MTTHTTEPMEIEDADGPIINVTCDGIKSIASFWIHHVGKDEALANAHLFKAAPKLLAMLKDAAVTIEQSRCCHDVSPCGVGVRGCAVGEYLEAIAEAEGEA